MKFPFLPKNKAKEQHDKPEYYPVCPNCLSPHLKTVSEFTSGWLTTPRYYCPNCHYSGIITLEIDIKLLETKTPAELKKMFLEEHVEDLDEEDMIDEKDNEDKIDQIAKQFCPVCGTALDLDAKFCSNCGETLT